jgi:PST family polysaccharide transporter
MRLSKYLRYGLTQNILALYGVHFVNYLLPLTTVPYVARVLGPTDWGLVVFAQAFGQYVTLLVEYGFKMFATREVSRYRDDRDKLANLTDEVLGAQGLLALFAIVLTLLVQHWLPVFQNYPLLWASVFSALALAFSPLWYYQGIERMQLVTTLGILTKVLFTVEIFLLVDSPKRWMEGACATKGGFSVLYICGTRPSLSRSTLPFSCQGFDLGCTVHRLDYVPV